MIRKLRRKFILIAVIALTVAMVLTVLVVNIANYALARKELRQAVELLADSSAAPGGRPPMVRSRHIRNMVNESMWFGVFAGEDGALHLTNVTESSATDEETALLLGEKAVLDGRRSAFVSDYVYTVRERGGGRFFIFLNCETRLASLRRLAWVSAAACAAGILIALLIVTLASRRAIAPMLRSVEQQKQFITDASHELKTPLTVISANMELLRMETPDNRWVINTQKQTAIMKRLVDELVYLSRLEEVNAPFSLENVDLTALVRETAEPFEAMAEYNGQTLEVTAEERVTVNGNASSLERLVSILCDNALKYAGGEGQISVTLARSGKDAVLTFLNPVAEPLTQEQCARLFERFYRRDPSRSRGGSGGFGIGLAIAAAITEKHGGSIRAEMNGGDLMITAVLPAV